MILGIDVSSYEETVAQGGKFYENGVEIDPIKDLYDQGCSVARIRVWVNPYDENGNTYYGGTTDEEHFFKHAKMMAKYGYTIMVDFHYSDYWADPAKQVPPKGMINYSAKELEKWVYDYTKAFMSRCRKEGIDVTYVQTGNEITNGMLFPTGCLASWYGGGSFNYQNFTNYLKAGIKAVKEEYPNAKTIIHVERIHLTDWMKKYFTHLIDAGVDFDIIGCSYYPYWHGSFEQLEKGLDYLSSFNKELFIIETGYAFTDYPYFDHFVTKRYKEKCRRTYLHKFVAPLEIPLTPQGQCDYIDKIFDIAKRHNVSGVFYWEPLWIASDGCKWCTKAGLKYNHDTTPDDHGFWANQCLFDYDHNKLPAFYHFKNK